MNENPVKRVAAIHDLSGFGRVSLNVVIPILSAMGIQVCSLPTAVLSSHSQYPDFRFRDLSEEMESFILHWKEMNLTFQAIYSGYLGSEKQIGIVKKFISDFTIRGTKVVIDPVLGDNGELYKSFSLAMVEGMKDLIRMADLITPNLTELSFLTGTSLKDLIHYEGIREAMLKLSETGPKTVVVTSVPEGKRKGRTSVLAYQKSNGKFWKVSCDYLPADYPGTGDSFTSVLTGSLLQGDSLPIALDRAVQFISTGVRATFGYDHDPREGILLEKILPYLNAPVQNSSYELMD